MYYHAVILSPCSLFHHQPTTFLVLVCGWDVLAAIPGYILTNPTGISQITPALPRKVQKWTQLYAACWRKATQL